MYFSFVGFVFLPLSTTAGCPGRNWYFSPSIKTIFQPCLASRCFDSEYLGWLVSTFSKIFFNKNINLKKSFYWPFLLQNIIISEDAKLNWTKNPKCQAEQVDIQYDKTEYEKKTIVYIFFKSPNWFVIKRILCQKWYLKMRRKYFYLFLLHFKLYSVVTVNRTHRESETVSLQSEIFYFAKYFAHAKKFAQNAVALNLVII